MAKPKRYRRYGAGKRRRYQGKLLSSIMYGLEGFAGAESDDDCGWSLSIKGKCG